MMNENKTVTTISKLALITAKKIYDQLDSHKVDTAYPIDSIAEIADTIEALLKLNQVEAALLLQEDFSRLAHNVIDTSEFITKWYHLVENIDGIEFSSPEVIVNIILTQRRTMRQNVLENFNTVKEEG